MNTDTLTYLFRSGRDISLNFINWMHDFLSPLHFTNVLGYIDAWWIHTKYQIYLNTVKESWQIAETILHAYHVSDIIASMFSNFNSDVLGILFYFQIPAFVVILIQAYVTRYVMSQQSFLLSIVGLSPTL